MCGELLFNARCLCIGFAFLSSLLVAAPRVSAASVPVHVSLQACQRVVLCCAGQAKFACAATTTSRSPHRDEQLCGLL